MGATTSTGGNEIFKEGAMTEVEKEVNLAVANELKNYWRLLAAGSKS